MLKNVLNMLAGAVIAASVGSAFAVIGTPPGTGFELIDGSWLNGFAAGHNRVTQYGFAAAGTTQATSTQLPSRVALMQVDTAGASSGVAMPPALAGMETKLYNNGAQTLTVYPSIVNNPVTAAQDTINNATSFSGGVATHVTLNCFVAKVGVWACKWPMGRRRHVLYGWRAPNGDGYCLSKIPPDVPLLPLDRHASIGDAEQAADDRRATVVWCGSALAEKERQQSHGRHPAEVGRL